MKKVSALLFILALATACSGGKATVRKGKGFDLNTKKVATLSVYDTSSGQVSTDDKVLSKFGSYAASQIADIYGNLIPGGDCLPAPGQQMA